MEPARIAPSICAELPHCLPRGQASSTPSPPRSCLLQPPFQLCPPPFSSPDCVRFLEAPDGPYSTKSSGTPVASCNILPDCTTAKAAESCSSPYCRPEGHHGTLTVCPLVRTTQGNPCTRAPSQPQGMVAKGTRTFGSSSAACRCSGGSLPGGSSTGCV